MQCISFSFLVRAKLFVSMPLLFCAFPSIGCSAIPLHFCAGQINAQLCRAVASLRIALPCHALPLLILSVPSASLRCSSMPLRNKSKHSLSLLCISLALLFPSYSAVPLLRVVMHNSVFLCKSVSPIFSVFLHHLLNFRRHNIRRQQLEGVFGWLRFSHIPPFDGSLTD